MTPSTPVQDTRLVIGPNASLSPGQAWACLGAMAAGSLLVAGVWTWLGFWPVLPFAGLELLAFGAALYVAMRDNRHREVIAFSATTVRLEIGRVGHGPEAGFSWPRGQVRVFLEAGRHRNSPTRLWLARGGRRVQIARWLTDADRARLALRLRALLLPGWTPGGTATDDPNTPAPAAPAERRTHAQEIGGFTE